MEKREVSYFFNKWTGGHEYLFCTRVYFNAKVWGGSWIALQIVIDVTFYVLFREKQHVRASYLWEVRNEQKQEEETKLPERK